MRTVMFKTVVTFQKESPNVEGGCKCKNPGFGFYLSRVRFAVLREVTVKIAVLRDVLPWTLVDK